MNTKYDVLIIGGGPAGLSTAYLCHKHGLSYLVLESGKAIFQGIANTYPEGKLVYASKPKDAPEPFMVDELRPPDKPVTVESYLQYVQHFVQHENLNVQTDVAFEDIKDERDGLTVWPDADCRWGEVPRCPCTTMEKIRWFISCGYPPAGKILRPGRGAGRAGKPGRV